MRFSQNIAPGGYGWWYIDALSDDGTQALTLIAFIGSVFSPYYAWANRHTPALAANHCAINLALYGKRGGLWAMRERGTDDLQQGLKCLRIGPSALEWDGARLHARIDEVCAPWPRRLRGSLTLTLPGLLDETFNLDAAGRHRWQPLAPRARIELAFECPKISWSGEAYLDHNEGDVPLARDFTRWHWSRGGGKILYDVECVDGSRRGLALALDAAGRLRHFIAPPEQGLPATRWGIPRATRADAGQRARVLRTFEDTPFYARSLISTWIDGAALTCMHESLSLTRFTRPWVQAMLPFRMPRALWVSK